jgi:hypothetical protein
MLTYLFLVAPCAGMLLVISMLCYDSLQVKPSAISEIDECREAEEN